MDYFSLLPKDVLIQLALEYDLPSLVKFCQSNKRINEIVCNNHTFWYNKLIKEFNLYKDDIPKSKKYNVNNPKEVYQFLHNKTKNIDGFLIWSAETGSLKLVKYSLDKGANIHIDVDIALRIASEKGYLEVVKYLVKSGANIHAVNDQALRLASADGYL